MRQFTAWLLSAALILQPTAGGSWATPYFRLNTTGTGAEQALSGVNGPSPLKGHVNGSISAQYSAVGGTPPVTFAATGLPPGTAISDSGQVAGAPLVAGNYSAVVAATDARGKTASLQVPFTVYDEIKVAGVGNVSVATGSRGTTPTPYLTGNPVAPAKWALASGALPPGYAVDPATGVVAGTSPTAGTWTMSLQGEDATGADAVSASFSIRVAAPSAQDVAGKDLYARANTKFASGAPSPGSKRQPPYAWTVAGALPPGLSVSPSTGVISGTPATAGDFPGITLVSTSTSDGTSATIGPFAVHVLDANSFPATADGAGGTCAMPQFVAHVDSPALTYPTDTQSHVACYNTLPKLANDDSASNDPQKAAATKVTWGLGPADSLPDGMNVEPETGHIVGTPTTTFATRQIRYVATDSTGMKMQSPPFNFSVYDAITISKGGEGPVVRFGMVSTSPAPQADGNALAPFSWAVDSRQTGDGYTSTPYGDTPAPTGLVVDPSTGALSNGAATRIGHWTTLVQVHDALGYGLSSDKSGNRYGNGRVGVTVQPALSVAVTAVDGAYVTATNANTAATIAGPPSYAAPPAGPSATAISVHANQPFTLGVVADKSGIAPYGGSVSSGSVPGGSVSQNPSGLQVQGLAGAVGSWSFAATLQNAAADPGTSYVAQATTPTVSLTAIPALSASDFRVTAPATVTQNVDLSQAVANNLGAVAYAILSQYPNDNTFGVVGGTLVGTPAAQGTHVVNLAATDATGPGSAARFTVTFDSTPQPASLVVYPMYGHVSRLTASARPTPVATVRHVTYSLSAAPGGTLPSWMGIDPDSGMVSGTPNAPFKGDVVVTGVDSASPPTTVSARMPVDVEPPMTVSYPDSTVRLSYKGDVAPTVANAAGPLAFTLASKPDGVDGIDPATGTVHLLPTTQVLASTPVPVHVVDGSGQDLGTTDAPFALTVLPQLHADQARGRIDVWLGSTNYSFNGSSGRLPYRLTASQAGANPSTVLPPVTFTQKLGVLPQGATLSPDGTIGGTPSGNTAGGGDVAVNPQDGAPQSPDLLDHVAIVSNPLLLNGGTAYLLPQQTVGTPASIPGDMLQSATGPVPNYDGPFSYAIDTADYPYDAMPNGLSLGADGTIFGTPLTDATRPAHKRTYHVHVTFSRLGGSGTGEILIPVLDPNTSPTASFTVDAPPAADVSAGYALTPAQSVVENPPGATWTGPGWALSGAPSGLSIDQSGNVTGTVPDSAQPGAYNATVSLSKTDDDGTVWYGSAPWTITVYAKMSVADGGFFPLPRTNQVVSNNGTPSFPYVGSLLPYLAGGKPPYVMTIGPVAGPVDGLTIAADRSGHDAASAGAFDGSVSGKPTSSGTVSYSLSITDRTGQSPLLVDRSFQILPPLAIEPFSLPTPYPRVGILSSGYNAALSVDNSPTPPLTFSYAPSIPGVTMDPSTGKFSGTPGAAVFGPSDAGVYKKDLPITVSVVDKAGAPASLDTTFPVLAPLTVALADQSVRVNQAARVPASGVPALYPSPVAPVSWTVDALPPGMSLDPATGVLTGTPTTTADYPISLKATDAQGAVGTLAAPGIVHVRGPISIPVAATDVVLRVGVANVTRPPALAGNPASVTWTIQGAVPAGTTFSPDGTISGSPTTVGDNAVSLTATADDGSTATTGSYTIHVYGPLHMASVQTEVARVSIPAHFDAPGVSNNPQTPLSWSVVPDPSAAANPDAQANGLPNGISLDTSIGSISGVATIQGDYPVVLTVRDSTGGADSGAFVVRVAKGLTMAAAPDETFRVGQSFALAAPVVSGNPQAPVGWTLAGSSPPGTVFDQSTGQVSGTPSVPAASAPYTLTINDKSGAQVSSNQFNLSTRPELDASHVADVTVRSGLPLSIPASTVTNVDPNFPALTWSVDPDFDALPAGIALNADGSVTGTPANVTSAKTSIVALDVEDNSFDAQSSSSPYQVTANALTATNSFAITVLPPLAIAGVSDATLHYGNAPNLAPTVQNQPVGQVAWSLDSSSGPLPSGLSVTPSTGRVDGAASQTGTFAGIVLKAVDAQGAVAQSKPFTLTVVPALTASTPSGYTNHVGNAVAVAAPTLGGGPQSPVTYALTGDSDALPPGVALQADGSISGATSGTLAQPTTSRVRVVATDSTGSSATTGQIRISVYPALTATLSAPSPKRAGAAATLAGPNVNNAIGAVAYALVGGLPPGMSLDPNTGAASGAPTQANSYPYALTVSDSTGATGGSATSNQVAVTVLAPLQMAQVSGTDGFIGVAYSLPAPALSNSPAAPVSWTYSGGALPPGLGLNADGTITGTPTQGGKFGPYVLTATDSIPSSVSSNSFYLSISTQVLARNKYPTMAYGLPSTVATFYDQSTATVATYTALGQAASVSFDVPVTADGTDATLAGYSLQYYDSATAQWLDMTGTKTSTDFRVLATGGSFPRALTGFRLSNGGAYPAYVPSLSPATVSGVDGTAISTQVSTAMAAVNVNGAPNYVLVSGALPNGLTLAANGLLSGTPTGSSTTTVKVAVTDASGVQSVPQPLTLVISPTVATLVAQSFHAGTAYTVSAPASNGTAPLAWAIATGSLPTGFAQSGSTGTISGTPTTAGQSTFSVSVTDPTGTTATSGQTTYTVAPAMTVATAQNRSMHTNSAYSFPAPSLANAVGAVTWTLASGTIPAGLALDPSSGTISGTPTSGASTTPALTATDSAGGVATTNAFRLDVFPTLTASTPASTSAHNNKTASTSAPTVGGGPVAPVTYALDASSNPLPPGLTLNSDGTITGTVTNATQSVATSSIVLVATDATGATAKTGAFTISAYPDLALAALPSATLRNGTPATLAGPTARFAIGTLTYAQAPSVPGMAFDATTGALSGTPTGTNSYSGTVSATDQAQGSASTAWSISVLAPMTMAQSTNTDGFVNAAYSLAAPTLGNGPQGTVTWSLATGTLPAGLALNPSTGAITGTPTVAGTASGLSLKATDSIPSSVTGPTFSITISAQQVLASNAYPSSASGVTTSVGTVYDQATATSANLTSSGQALVLAFAQPVTADGFDTSYTGLTPQYFDGGSNQWLALTRTQTSTQFRVLSTVNSTVTVTGLRLGYQGAYPAYTPSTSPATINASTGQALTTSLATAMSAINVRGAASWAIVSGQLPDGVSLSTNGTLSGTPTATASTAFQVSVTDVSGVASAPQTVTYIASATAASAIPNALYLNGTAIALNTGSLGALYDNVATTAYAAGSGNVVAIAFPQAVAANTLNSSGIDTTTLQYCSANCGTYAGATFTAIAVTGGALASTVTSNLFRATSNATSVAAFRIGYNGAYPTTVSTTAGETAAVAGSQTNLSLDTVMATANATGGETWTVTTGSLPAGLSISGSTLTGTMTDTSGGDASVTLVVNDANNVPGSPQTLLIHKLVTATADAVYPSNGTITGTTYPNASGQTNLAGWMYDASASTYFQVYQGNASPTDTPVTFTYANAVTVDSMYSDTVGTSTNAAFNYIQYCTAYSGQTCTTWATAANKTAGNGVLRTAAVSSKMFRVLPSGSVTGSRSGAVYITPATIMLGFGGQFPAATPSTTAGEVGIVAGTAYSASLDALMPTANATGNETWTVTSGALPTGLTISGSTLSGTISAANAGGDSVVYLSVTDASGVPSVPMTLTIHRLAASTANAVYPNSGYGASNVGPAASGVSNQTGWLYDNDGGSYATTYDNSLSTKDNPEIYSFAQAVTVDSVQSDTLGSGNNSANYLRYCTAFSGSTCTAWSTAKTLSTGGGVMRTTPVSSTQFAVQASATRSNNAAYPSTLMLGYGGSFPAPTPSISNGSVTLAANAQNSVNLDTVMQVANATGTRTWANTVGSLPTGMTLSGSILSGKATGNSGTVSLSVTDASGVPSVPKVLTFTVATTAASNLVGYYKFDEGSGSSAADSTGNGQTASISTPNWSTGIVNSGVTIASSANNPTVPTGTWNGPTGIAPRTIQAWIKTTTASVNGNEILAWGQAVPYKLYGIYVTNNTFNVTNGNTAVSSSTVTVNDGNWHHAVVTDTGTSAILYYDGVQVGSGSLSGTATSPGTALIVGANAGGAQYTGSVDEVGVWSRVLSSAEISKLYNSGLGGQASNPNAQPMISAATITTTKGTAQSKPLSAVMALTNGSQTVWTVSSGSLPAGVTLNAKTGILGGTPTATGTNSVGITATNFGGASSTATLTYTVN